MANKRPAFSIILDELIWYLLPSSIDQTSIIWGGIDFQENPYGTVFK